MTLPFDQIAGQRLTGEQRSYLDGLFAGLANRGLKFSDVEANPADAPAKPASASDLIFEERIKRELHPLDAWELLGEHAAANKAPERENIFRFKWHGLFFLTPAKEAFMARLRIPGGQLKTFQLRELSRVASELTSGYVQVTTRANLQMRLIQPKDAPELVRRIQGVGLHTRGAGADNIRNITCNPTAGIDPHELIDTMPFAHELGQLIISSREFYDLPRKFNVAFDGGGLIGSLEDTNDIGLTAVRVTEAQGDVKPGVYFRCALGGATGHKAFAEDLGVLIRPEEAVKVTAALIRVYIANGNRSDRKKARLKHLLEKWTLAQYLQATEKLLGYRLIRAGSRRIAERTASPLTPALSPLRGEGAATSESRDSNDLVRAAARSPSDASAPSAAATAPTFDAAGRAPSPLNGERAGVRGENAQGLSTTSTAPPHSHVGVFPQRQSGLNYIGVALPVGQITPKQMLRLAEIVDLYGSGEVRLTVWQNLVIPNVPDAYVETVKKALVKMGLHWKQSNIRSGLVACTGNSYCKFASANTKGHALAIAEHLEKRVPLDRPVNIHLTGCPNSCAQHYIGDIGLLGAKVKVSGETVEGYHVFVGGGFGANRAVGRQVFQGLSFEDVKATIERMLCAYLKHRVNGESFQQFAARHDVGRLQELFAQET